MRPTRTSSLRCSSSLANSMMPSRIPSIAQVMLAVTSRTNMTLTFSGPDLVGLTVRFSRLNARNGLGAPGSPSGPVAVTATTRVPTGAPAPAWTSISPRVASAGRVRLVAVTPLGKSPSSTRTGPRKLSRATITPKLFWLVWSTTTPGETLRLSPGGRSGAR